MNELAVYRHAFAEIRGAPDFEAPITM